MSVPTMAPESSKPKDGSDIRPNIDHLVTEDGEPVDSVYSEKQMRLLTEPLYASWEQGKPFVAMANVGLFYGVRIPPIVPDVMLSRHVEAPPELFEKNHRSYLVWEYGKPPEVAIEVVSNLEGEETTRKPKAYAQAGVPYYVIWDPDRMLGEQALQVFELRAQTYAPITGDWLPLVELGVKVWHGVFEGIEYDWLRWCDAGGSPIPTGAERAAEAVQRAEFEALRSQQLAQRVQQEAQRAEQEAHRAEQEAQRANRLAEQLRALGATPRID